MIKTPPDIEIAQKHKKQQIADIAKKIGLEADELELHGNFIAKVDIKDSKRFATKEGNLILVTAITPTKAGEGKTTVTIGLGDGLSRLNKRTVICLREPSMGPVFGLKGGATGGGYSQVLPMEDINLHFTGDMHAITAANNLIAACLDNHIYQGNELNIDENKVVWKRCLDINDRTLRNVIIGIGKANGIERPDGFNITVASEVMAVFCLAKDLADFKVKIGKCIVAYTKEDKPITVKDLGIVGSVTLLMKQALKPNIVQTLEGTPALIHGGPFANIAHGCNSLIATKLGLQMADFVVTEAGFGADLGAEKFLDIKCREGQLNPNMVVIVATIRALKMHGGKDSEDLNTCDIEALLKGVTNLEKHIENIQAFNVPYVIAINKFANDTKPEIEALLHWCKKHNHPVFFTNVYEEGGRGAIQLAEYVATHCDKLRKYKPIYELEWSIEQKISKIAQIIYGARQVIYTDKALEDLKLIKKYGYEQAYICMAKTQNSLSDNAKLIGRPRDFDITIKEIRLSAGANFIIPLAGAILTMPGLPKTPAANKIDIDEAGTIKGLF